MTGRLNGQVRTVLVRLVLTKGSTEVVASRYDELDTICKWRHTLKAVQVTMRCNRAACVSGCKEEGELWDFGTLPLSFS